MDSAALLRSFHCTTLHVGAVLERPAMVGVYDAAWPSSSKSPIQGLTFGGKLGSSPMKRENMLVSCGKTPEATETSKSNGAVLLDSPPEVSLEKSTPRNAIFPSGFEALVLQVCDETQIAELKLKVGDFEMHLKRNLGALKASIPVTYPPPPIPSMPMIESTPSVPAPSSSKSSTEKISPFTNVSVEKLAKLAALEASGSSGYVLVSSPTVGSFRRGRTLKGKKQPPICKQGDIIKEGQVIGYLDQFGTLLPVKSDVAGEVLKLLVDDGEAVGYGDPLVAVLPSFHSIRL